MNLFLSSKSDLKSVMALVRCRQPDNEGLLAIFKQLLDETKSALIEADGEHFRRLQGRAKVLQDFLEAVNDSPSALERMR